MLVTNEVYDESEEKEATKLVLGNQADSESESAVPEGFVNVGNVIVP